MNAVVIYREVEERETAVALIEAAEVLIDKGDKYQVIETDADAELLGEYRARVNKHITDLDKERLDMGSGLRDTLDKINSKFNTPIAALKTKRDRADFLIRKYLQDKRNREEAERREAEKKAREEAERVAREHEENVKAAEVIGIEPPPPPAPVIVAPPPVAARQTIQGTFGSRVALKDNWKYRIVNIKKVPENFLVPVEDRVNRSALNALAKSMKDKASVPGIEFYNDEGIGSRVVT